MMKSTKWVYLGGTTIVSRTSDAYRRAWCDKNRTQCREYSRNYMRKRRDTEYLIELELEAQERGMTTAELVKRLMTVIVADNLFSAVLG